MPSAVVELLSFFEVLNINIGGVGLPLQCFGLGLYRQQLIITMLAPLLLAAGLVVGFVLRSWCGGGPKKGRCAGLLDPGPGAGSFSGSGFGFGQRERSLYTAELVGGVPL
jgi:hypothetical protein